MSNNPNDKLSVRRIVRRKPMSGRLKLLVVAAILWAVGCASVGVLVVGWQFDQMARDKPGRTPPKVHVGQVPQVVNVAPQQPPLQDDAVLRQKLTQFFVLLGHDWAKQDRDKIAQHFDLDRMLDEICTVAGVPLPTPAQRLQAAAGFQAGLKDNFFGGGAWTDTDVRQVEILQPDEVRVVTRHFDRASGVNSYRCWWLRADGPSWRIYDLEDLEFGVRVSTVSGGFAADVMLGRDRGWAGAGQFVRKIVRPLVQGDVKTVEAELAAVKDVRFPDQVEAFRWLIHAALAVRQQQHARALEFYAKAEQFNPKLSLLALRRAYAYNGTKDFEKARQQAQQFIAAVGEDNEVCHQLGFALAHLGRLQEAAAAFRRSLKFDPENSASIDELRRVLPAKDKGEIATHFLKLTRPADHYDVLARNAFDARDLAGLVVLAEAMRQQWPDDPEALFHLAHVRAQEKQWPAAWPLYQRALEKQPDAPRRQYYSDQFLYDLVDDGKALEGYQKAADKDRAFRVLAADLYTQRKGPDLRRLLELHQKDHPKDTLLEYYFGEQALDDGRFADAETHFARVAVGQLEEPVRKQYLSRRLFANFKIGKGLAAYREAGATREAFDQLAALLAQAREVQQLKELVNVHRQNIPDDPNLRLWEGEALWLAKDYIATWALLARNRQALLQHAQHSHKWRSRLFLCLFALKKDANLEAEVRAVLGAGLKENWQHLQSIYADLRLEKKNQEALAFARACNKLAPNHPDSLWLLARAHAGNQQPEQAVQYFRQACTQQQSQSERQRYQRTFLYDMMDAGRALAGYQAAIDAKAAFRLLAQDLVSLRKWEDLRQLLQAHRQKQADDLWLDFYQGELALQEKQFGKAEKILAAGLARATDNLAKDSFRRRLNLARFHTQGAVAVYQELGPGEQTFNQLAYFCTRPEDAGPLEQLLAAHRKHAPGDKRLRLWEVEVKWLAGDYRETVRLLRQHRAEILADNSHRWKYEDRLIRSLVRLKDFAAARQELAVLEKEERPNLLLTVLVPASAGDVAGTVQALKRWQARGFFAGSLYSDPDLGPILRSEPFRQVREQFPEPKQPLDDPWDDRDDDW